MVDHPSTIMASEQLQDEQDEFRHQSLEEENPLSCWSQTKKTLAKYFWQGQQLDQTAKQVQDYQNDQAVPFHVRHRKLLAMSIPAIVVHIVWWSIMMTQDSFYLFTEPLGSYDKPRYYMSITMVFGSMVAGATSEGGGAVAFPVMTLALGIAPPVARDFSFMIQSVGMVGAAFTILVMRVAVEWKALLYVSLGGVAGIILGLEQVAPRLAPPYSKMYFVCIWSSFAIGLFLLNRTLDRTVFSGIQDWESGMVWKAPGALGRYLYFHWKRETLLAFGILGGIFSSMSGSGIDICSFSALTLLFRVSEKVATPTSVILMAINTTVGFAYREFGMGGVADDAWGFLAVCAPIVVIGAPLGAFLGSYWHRLTLAGIIYIIDAAQLIGALYVIQPWTTNKTDTPLHLSLTSLAIFLGGAIFFRLLTHFGLKLSEESATSKPRESTIDSGDSSDGDDGKLADEEEMDTAAMHENNNVSSFIDGGERGGDVA